MVSDTPAEVQNVSLSLRNGPKPRMGNIARYCKRHFDSRTRVPINLCVRGNETCPVFSRFTGSDPDARVKCRPKGKHSVDVAVMQPENGIKA